jgi:hypothetical protein
LTRDGLFRHGNLTYSRANQSDLVVTLRSGMVVVRPATTHREQLVSLTWTHQLLGGITAMGIVQWQNAVIRNLSSLNGFPCQRNTIG